MPNVQCTGVAFRWEVTCTARRDPVISPLGCQDETGHDESEKPLMVRYSLSQKKMEYRLRKAENDDWTFIWSLRVATMKDLINDSYGWDESIQQSYAQESLKGEIVLVDDNPVGVLTLTDWGDQLHLVWMAILPEKQCQGLGTALVEYSQQQAREKNRILTLQVLKNNRAQSLYRKCGFEIYGHNSPDKLLMRWQPNIT